ncbi:hypothetical protein D3C84_895460 [compost metagenome]
MAAPVDVFMPNQSQPESPGVLKFTDDRLSPLRMSEGKMPRQPIGNCSGNVTVPEVAPPELTDPHWTINSRRIPLVLSRNGSFT